MWNAQLSSSAFHSRLQSNGVRHSEAAYPARTKQNTPRVCLRPHNQPRQFPRPAVHARREAQPAEIRGLGGQPPLDYRWHELRPNVCQQHPNDN
jgi:hypothetical protein